MRTLIVALLAALVSSPAWAKKEKDAENWANKNGTLGIGAGMTLPGHTGAQVRYYATKDIGLLLTLAADMNSGSIEPDGGDSYDVKATEIDVGLYGEYKIVKHKQGSFAGVVGIDYETYKWEVDTADDSFSDMQIGLGAKGEAFLTPKFSIYSQLGLAVDMWGDAEKKSDMSSYVLDPEKDDIKGNSIRLGGGLLGSAGFTYWFG